MMDSVSQMVFSHDRGCMFALVYHFVYIIVY